ncbi:MAG: putative toxin-antitoxin system toxin component, PIN family [Candidatus Sulfotelmatobacter sp.]
MLPLRLVLDTNVVVSAAIRPTGLQRTVLTLALTKPSRLYISQPILDEYRDVLARARFRIPKGLRQQFLQQINDRSHQVAPLLKLAVAHDPDDNIFIECADAARADYLITGNQKHFPKFWKQTKVITSREFISLVAPHLTT